MKERWSRENHEHNNPLDTTTPFAVSRERAQQLLATWEARTEKHFRVKLHFDRINPQIAQRAAILRQAIRQCRSELEGLLH